MAKRKPREKIDPNSWMNTYSDMVTLLLCFFVMLYAASTPDQTKWQYIFQSFTSSGTYINPFVMDEDPNLTDSDSDDGNSLEPPGSADDENDHQITNSDEIPTNFNELASWAAAVAQAAGYSSDEVSVVVNSSGSITIRFSDSVLFGPDSAELLESGQKAISMFLPGIKAISEYIGGIDVSGHTAVGVSSVNDWDLSAARACSVVKFMDYRRVVESEVYEAIGLAQYSPIADNDTEEGRAQNRRVEITITRNDNNAQSNEVIEDILKYDYGIGSGTGNNALPSEDDAVSQIISKLEDKYQATIDQDGTVLGSESGPVITPPITGIPESAIHELDEDGNIIIDDSEVSDSDSESETDE